LGLDGIPSPGKQSQAQWLQEAIEGGMAQPDVVMDLAVQIVADPRTLTPQEDMSIKYVGAQFSVESQRLGQEARKATDEASRHEIEAQRKIVDGKIELLTRASDLAGTEWSRAGVSRQVDIDDDGNLQNNIHRLQTTSGKSINEKDRAKLTKLTDDLVEARAKLQTAEEQLRVQKAKKAVREGSQRRYSRMSLTEKDAELSTLKQQVTELLGAGC
jgi:hypothetical protein